MIRALAVGATLALALAFACQVPDRHFHVGDAAPIGSDVMAMIDTPPPPCRLDAPFGSGVPLTSITNGSQQQMEPRLTHDELQIYWWVRPLSSGSGGEMWTAVRSSVGSAFGPSQRMDSLDVFPTERDPSPTGDNLTLYYAVFNGSADDIYSATRASTTVAFGSGSPVLGLSTVGTRQFNPYVMPDNRTLYLADTGSGTDDLEVVSRSSLGVNFGAPDRTPFAMINTTTSSERNPVVTLDQLTLYFASNRGSGVDIYKSTRASTSAPFDAPAKVTELSTDATGDYPGWISDDGCRLYYDSSLTGSNQFHVYVATKPAS